MRCGDASGEEVRGSTEDRIALLLRTSRVGSRPASWRTREILDQALSLVDRQRQPLLASTLLAERGYNAWLHDPSNTHVRPELLEAVQLTASFPDSPERAVALAHLVDAELWDLRTSEIPPHIWVQVREAVDVAQRSGSGAAMAQALCCRARYLAVGPPVERGPRGCRGVLWAGPADRAGGHHGARGDLEGRRSLGPWAGGGSRRTGAGSISGAICVGILPMGLLPCRRRQPKALLDLGRWTQCNDILRDALSARRGGLAGADVRQVAARLATRRGQAAIAQQHLDRSLELVPLDFIGLERREISLELLVGRGDSKGALELFPRFLTEYLSVGVHRNIDELLLWGARAAADVAERARDRRDLDAEGGGGSPAGRARGHR